MYCKKECQNIHYVGFYGILKMAQNISSRSSFQKNDFGACYRGIGWCKGGFLGPYIVDMMGLTRSSRGE